MDGGTAADEPTEDDRLRGRIPQNDLGEELRRHLPTNQANF